MGRLVRTGELMPRPQGAIEEKLWFILVHERPDSALKPKVIDSIFPVLAVYYAFYDDPACLPQEARYRKGHGLTARRAAGLSSGGEQT